MTSRFVRMLVLVLTIASSAFAEREAAKELFRSGRAAYERGDYLAAAHSFEQAYGEDATAEALYNAGLSWQSAGRSARAANHYRRALALGGLDASLAREAERAITELRQKLALIQVEAADGSVSIADYDNVPLPAEIFVEPGSHAVRLHRKNGTESVQNVTVAAGATTRVAFAIPAPTTQPKPLVPKRQRANPPADTGTGFASTQRALAWTAVGLSVVASGAAIFLGTRAVSARDDWVDSDLTDRDAYDRAHRLKNWTNIAWVGALVFGTTGVTLLLTDTRRASSSSKR